jgi:predicted HAD superfamily Cof-like phosphohydrolase
MKTSFQQVSEFTTLRLNAGKPKDEFVHLPTKPTLLTKQEVRKFIGLCASEMVELARTVTESNAEATEFVKDCVGMDPSATEPVFNDDIDRLSEQIDAVTDLYIYSADMSSGHGFNLDKVFPEVHAANMSKTFPDGTFHLKEIAPGIFKVAKPPNFTPPNVRKVVEDMLKNGSW